MPKESITMPSENRIGQRLIACVPFQIGLVGASISKPLLVSQPGLTLFSGVTWGSIILLGIIGGYLFWREIRFYQGRLFAAVQQHFPNMLSERQARRLYNRHQLVTATQVWTYRNQILTCTTGATAD